jgi:IS5 family transposase
MQSQVSFSQSEFSEKKKVTRREKFLDAMELVVPWVQLVAIISPFYPKGERGRPPIGIERMLRIYFLQQWYSLSDELIEETIYDSLAMRIFTGIDLSIESVPDATTLLKFRRLLETHGLTKQIFEEVKVLLQKHNMLLQEGTIIDATIIGAPSSTKNKSKARDPEMHQTRKGEQCYFGMKSHIGVDTASGMVHSLEGTAANEADITQAHALLTGKEEVVFADAGYIGVEKREEVIQVAPNVEWQIAAKRGKIKAMPEGLLKELYQKLESTKASVRAKVEHPFHVLKNLFGYRMVRYRGLAKNIAQQYTLFALVNLFMGRKVLLGNL